MDQYYVDQYYICVNLTKKEFLTNHKGFAKLMEHSWMQNSFLFAANYLLTPGQDWYKTRIVWAGDCMDVDLFLPKTARNKKQNLYDYAAKNYRKRFVDVYKILSNMYPKHAIAKMLEGHDKDYINFVLIGKFNEDFPYIVNHTKKEYVDKQKCPPCPDDYTIHPLSLLTASGNGQGGGDFHGNNQYVGTWAGDVLSAESLPPAGYKEIRPDFIE